MFHPLSPVPPSDVRNDNEFQFNLSISKQSKSSFDGIRSLENIILMWEVVSTKEFEKANLNDSERKIIASDIRFIEEFGFSLGRPYVDTLKGSKLNNLKELRTKLNNKVIRIFFVFDPKRRAVLLLKG